MKQIDEGIAAHGGWPKKNTEGMKNGKQ